MRGREGYIKLHRSLLDWEWYKDPNTRAVWIHILLNANWKDGRFKGNVVKRGQMITTIRGLAKELKLSPRNVRTALQHLHESGEITTHGLTSQYTVINVEKYALYQADETSSDTRSDTRSDKRPTKDRQKTDTDIRKEEGKKERKDIITTITLLDRLGGGDLDKLLERIDEECHLDFMDLLSDIDASEIAKPYQYALQFAKNHGFIKGR